jgi:Ser/Thr protein kinase RdoA (MazF antagonist)
MLREYTQAELLTLLKEEYNVEGTLKQLDGYFDRNYRVTENTENPKRYILKISSAQEQESIVRMHTYVLSHIKDFKADPCHFPEIIPTLKGENIISLGEGEGSKVNFVRLFKYIEGEELSKVKDLPSSIFEEIGAMAARLSDFLRELYKSEELKDLVKAIDMDNYIENLWMFPKMYENDRKYI